MVFSWILATKLRRQTAKVRQSEKNFHCQLFAEIIVNFVRMENTKHIQITIKKGTEIHDVETWYVVAPPKDPKLQWKNGRSAKELARFATDPSFSDFIQSVLKNAGIAVQDFICEPEAETYFEKQDGEKIDMGINGPRNHDLLMIGKTCVIGVEAKVSEKFGNNTVQIEWEKAKTQNKKVKRIPGLIEFLSNGKYKDYESTPESIKRLQYQLLTATVGTVLEAKRKLDWKRNKNIEAIVLVLVFTGNVAKENGFEQNVQYNNDALKAFIDEFFEDGVATIQGIKCRIVEREVKLISNYKFD